MEEMTIMLAWLILSGVIFIGLNRASVYFSPETNKRSPATQDRE